jgi:formyl-CoA transferase
LDLASDGGRVVLMKMLEGADVLIETKPGTLDKWGIGNVCCARNSQTRALPDLGLRRRRSARRQSGYDAIIRP